MSLSASEKVEVIRIVEDSELSIRRTLAELGISRSSFYRWYQRYQAGGPDALESHSRSPRRFWNKLGLVLPVYDTGRLFTLYHQLEAHHVHGRQ